MSDEEQLSPPGEDEYYVEDKEVQTDYVGDKEVQNVEDKEVQTKNDKPEDTDDINKVTQGISNLNTEANKSTTVEPMDTSEPSIIIFAPFALPSTMLNEKEAGIKWIGLPRMTIESVTARIMNELRERDPQKAKWITVSAFQQFIASHDSATLEKHLAKITRATMDAKIHKLSFTTFFHVPEMEKIWDRISMLNQHVRLLNLDLGRPPNNAHKGLTFSFNKGIVCYVRHEIWVERMNETGVGATLNYEGLLRYKNYLLKYIHQGGFQEQDGPLVRAIGGDGSPAPLCFTNGYKDNDKMMAIIEELGLRMPTKPAGDKRSPLQQRIDKARALAGDKRSPLQQRIDKARAVARRFSTESNAKYGHHFKEEESRNKTEKQEDKESRMRMSGKERLEQRDKARKENKEHQLTLEVNRLKMESLRARSRSKGKYEEFEKEIGKLKDRLRQKEKQVSELRRDIARAEVDCEEWRELAEQANVYHRGPKRARRH